MTRPLPWPDVTGARTKEGYVCVGARHDNRSKYTRTTLLFYDPKHRRQYECPAHKVAWADGEDVGHNAEILGNALRNLMVSKKAPRIHQRAMIAAQQVDTFLYLYEAGYHASLYPRLRWKLPYSTMGYVRAMVWAIEEETRNPDKVLAEEDPREPAGLKDWTF